MKRPILQNPAPCLREIAAPVTEFGAELHQLLDDMADTLDPRAGIALAAPQVGVSTQAIVIRMPGDTVQEIINPQIVKRSLDTKVALEGCLSINGGRSHINTARHRKVTVNYQDRHGASRSLVARGLLSRCVQHEMDHLQGKLIIDR